MSTTEAKLHPPARHTTEHWTRVRAEVARAIDEVPLYAGRPAPPDGDSPEQLSAWLAAMPTIGKRELRRGFPKALVRRSNDLKAEMAAGRVEIISTSGTVENRLQVLWEWTWWDPQEREAMRLNARVARTMAAEFREAVLTTPVCGGSTCHVGNLSRAERTIDGMLFLNQLADPTHWTPGELDRMVLEWNDFRPAGVEADPAYLAALCRHVTASGGRLHSPAFVTLTYEQITRAHRRQIAAVIESPLYSLYGATECGVLFMECDAGRLHHNTRHSHIELLDAGGGMGRVLVTTLGRTWMPLVRYDVGDLVRLAPDDDVPCRCGREQGGYLLERVEGRAADCIGSPDGKWITPAALDDAVDAADPTIAAWQLALDGSAAAGSGTHTLRVVGSDGKAAAEALAALLGARVQASREMAIVPEGSGKYRLVRS
ncbi:MAG TPA: hypothetical protein VFF06_10075 [Polyangia bacterium]|nr:hypothetical protein [Polyangia bacterium]